MTGFDGVVFDMDGVIFDTETVGLRSWEAVGKRHGFENVLHYARECIGRSTKDSMKIMTQAYGDIDIAALKDECEREFADIIAREGLIFKKGARELLDWLKENGIKTAIASSTSRAGVLSHLKRTGTEDRFLFIVGGDMVENSKPEPEIYLKACEGLGTAPANTFAIEDSNNGMISAHRAGMRALLVPDIVENTAEAKSYAERIFSDLFEVKEYFRQHRTTTA